MTYGDQVVSAGGYAGDGMGFHLTLSGVGLGKWERVRVCEARELEKLLIYYFLGNVHQYVL